MTRTKSLNVKIFISIIIFIFGLFFFYISYQEFSKYYQRDLVLFEDMNINYFDKDLFQKYYEKIDIESLSDPQFDEENQKITLRILHLIIYSAYLIKKKKVKSRMLILKKIFQSNSKLKRN
jgi:hypothetical protein